MRLGTNVNLNTAQKQTPTTPNQWADALPTVGGIGGQFLGGALGTVGGALIPGAGETGASEVLGERIGQTLGGVGGQGGGEILKELLQGQKINPTAVESQGAQGGLYANVPGGKIAEGIVNPLTRVAAKAGVRAVGGGAVGGATQAIRNVQQKKPLMQNVGGQAVLSGALNTVLPAGAELLGVVGKIPQYLGKRGGEMARSVTGRKGMAEIQSVQKLLGSQTIDTGEGGAKINNLTKQLFQKYGYTPPPQGNVSSTADFLNRAGSDIEKQLQPLLQATTTSYSKDVQPIINKNLTDFFGTTNTGAKNSYIPLELKTFLNKMGSTENMNLSQLKDFQRGLKNYGKWPLPDNPSPMQRFANSLYRDTGNLIDKKLSDTTSNEKYFPQASDRQYYQNLQQQHQAIAKMRDNFEPYTQGKALPTEALSKEMGQSKMLSGLLSQERATQIALAALLGGTTAMPGIPKEAKTALDVAELAMLGPAAFPQAGPAIESIGSGIGNAMQSPSNSQTVMKLLSQLGVRLPSVATQ